MNEKFGSARLIVLDVDSTLIREEVIDVLAAQVGCQAQVAALTERAMRGELDFAASLRERVALLAGLPEQVVMGIADQLTFTPGAPELVAVALAGGHQVALVSGGFHSTVDVLAGRLGITLVAANRLEVADGVLTGRVVGAIVDRAGKAAALRRFAAESGIPLSDTVAVGDGANDIDMVLLAGLGVALAAKPALCEVADVCLDEADLTPLVGMLGLE